MTKEEYVYWVKNSTYDFKNKYNYIPSGWQFSWAWFKYELIGM